MKTAVILILILIALVAVLLSRFVWLPDIVTGRRAIVACVSNSVGDSFQVVQYWNEDFYCSLLKHGSPSGETNSVVLDPDGYKLWSCRIIFQTNDTATILTGRKEPGRYDVVRKQLIRPNGLTIQADRE